MGNVKAKLQLVAELKASSCSTVSLSVCHWQLSHFVKVLYRKGAFFPLLHNDEYVSL